jgi:hypothetical protein
MNEKVRSVFAASLAIAGAWASMTPAQSVEIKEKPPMYTFVSNWVLPRAQWSELDKARAGTEKVFASASLVGYGEDETLLHQAEGSTHEVWWSAMSMAALMGVLENLRKRPSPALNAATKHWDGIYVSRFYNWHSGSSRGAYTQTTSYKLNAGAPDDAVQTLSKYIFVPLLEKLLSDGTLIEYEVDVQAEHAEAPGTFWISFITAKAEGLDKVNESIGETFKANPLVGPAFGADVDFGAHRDYLYRTDATYK